MGRAQAAGAKRTWDENEQWANGKPTSAARPVEGRWPANLVTDGSDEVVGMFPSPHGAGAARAEPIGGEYAGQI
jgi:hypothetical protein